MNQSMPRHAATIALLVGGMLLAPVSAHAEDGPGVLSGQVVNATPGAAPAAGLEVALGVYRANDLEREVQGQTDETGHFRFVGLDADRDLTYQVGTVYQDMLYRSNPIQLTEAQPEQQVALNVYEPTSTDPGLRATQVLVSLGRAKDNPADLVVTELVKLTNPSERTFVPRTGGGPGGPMDLVRFGLPAGARNFEPGLGLDARQVVQVDRGFASLAPVPPGDSLFRFSYRLPVRAAEDAFEKSLPYGADLLRVMAEEGGPRVTGSTLTFEQTVNSRGSKLLVWAAHDLAPGTQLSIELSDLPGPPAWTARVGDAVASPWMVAALVALLPLLGVFWTVLGRLRAPVVSAQRR